MLVERPICTCDNCNMDLYEGQTAYSVEYSRGYALVCEDCADEWFEEYKKEHGRELKW